MISDETQKNSRYVHLSKIQLKGVTAANKIAIDEYYYRVLCHCESIQIFRNACVRVQILEEYKNKKFKN